MRTPRDWLLPRACFGWVIQGAGRRAAREATTGEGVVAGGELRSSLELVKTPERRSIPFRVLFLSSLANPLPLSSATELWLETELVAGR